MPWIVIAPGIAQEYLHFMSDTQRIVVDPEIRSGKPCVKGTRIAVVDVLEYMAGGMSVEEIVEDFPSLTREDVLACLAFAADRERGVETIAA